MKLQLQFILRPFLILVLFLSIGEGSLYAKGIYELREEQPFSSEKISAAKLLSIAVQENPLQQISEFSKQSFFDSNSVIPHRFDFPDSLLPATGNFHFLRDLRRGLEIQLFPKHFFL